MWKVLGNESIDDSSVAPRQPQRRSNAPSKPPRLGSAGNEPTPSVARSTAAGERRKGPPEAPVFLCGKYRITGTMRKGATGYLYSGILATHAADDGKKGGDGGVDVGLLAAGAATVGVVLKVEECAAPKRQMHNEWQVYRALEAQRIATRETLSPLPAHAVGGFPRAEFFTVTMPTLPLVPPFGDELGAGDEYPLGGARHGEAMGTDGPQPDPERAVNVLAMERLGDNLMMLSQTTLRLGAQMVSLLRMLHSAGYVHRDVKPENFCVGRGRAADRVYLIDYGLAYHFGKGAARQETPSSSGVSVKRPEAVPMGRQHTAGAVDAGHAHVAVSVDQRREDGAEEHSDEVTAGDRSMTNNVSLNASTKEIAGEAVTDASSTEAFRRRPTDVSVPAKPTSGPTGLVGSVRYLSIAAHAGARQTFRCDLESLGYVLIYLVRGKLPWQGLTAKTREVHMEKIRKSKVEETPETLCKGLPALAEYLSYIRSLGPGEPADYSRAEAIFTEGLRRRGFSANVPFDWMNGHLHPGATGLAVASNRSAMGSASRGGGSSLDSRAGGKRVTAAGGSDPNYSTASKRPRVGQDGLLAAGASPVVGVGSVGGGSAAGGSSPGETRGSFIGVRGSGGRMCGAAAVRGPAAIFDLYADVPPPESKPPTSAKPDQEVERSLPEAEAVNGVSGKGDPWCDSVEGRESRCSRGAPFRGPTRGGIVNGKGADAPDTTNRDTGERSSGSIPVVHDGKAGSGGVGEARTALEASEVGRTATTSTTPRGLRIGGETQTSSGSAGHVDVSLALAKLRPHLVRGSGAGGVGPGNGSGVSKKLPKACALFTDLLSAKMDATNEEMFFDVIAHVVEGCRGSGRAKGDSGAKPEMPVEDMKIAPIENGIERGAKKCGGAGFGSAGLRAEGASGAAVRRLVVAACAMSSVFAGSRREKVQAWADEARKVGLSQQGER